jgi:hypothetical protein
VRFPDKTSHASGTIRPRAGFKRFSTDPLLTPYRIPPYRLRKEHPEQCGCYILYTMSTVLIYTSYFIYVCHIMTQAEYIAVLCCVSEIEVE